MSNLPVIAPAAVPGDDAVSVHLAGAPGIDPALAILIAGTGGPARGPRMAAATVAGRAALIVVPGEGEPVVAARAMGVAIAQQAGHAVIALHGAAGAGTPEAIRSLFDGLLSAAYRFDRHRTRPAPSGPRLERVDIVLPGDPAGDALILAAWEAARTSFAATALVRDLVNEIPSTLNPSAFAAIASGVAGSAGLDVEVLDEADLAELGCGGILGVGRGSAEPPRLVKLRTRTEDPVLRVALVGKGITFDAGGLFLKRPEGMVTMKGDMAGAAAVLGAMSVVSQVAPRVEVRGYLALSENLPGPRATKPGDVLRTRNGLTIEVNDPDCEGRMVLSDALALAGEDAPDLIIDLATLTGSKGQAVGAGMAAIYATDDRMAALVSEAGTAAGEPVWRLPLWDPYRARLDSAVADLRLCDPSPHAPDSIIAALYLREFVPAGTSWVHVDMASNELAERDGEVPEGMATGFGARLLLELLVRLGQG